MSRNLIKTWTQGKFIDQGRYANTPEALKSTWREEETHLVRPAHMENAICHCRNPDDAIWIAQRLNLAATLEQMTYDFTTGKTDGAEITAYVQANVND